MKAVLVEDSQILIPNPTHKNFTRTNEILPKGNVVEGEIKVVEGLKKGEPFNYRLFFTNKNQIIYVKNIKPMETTEVKLGADGNSNPKGDVLTFPSTSNLGPRPIIGTLAGAALGYAAAKYVFKKEGKTKIWFALGGAVVGFIVGKYAQSKAPIKLKK
ncbi:MAG: glycine zipper 2TM domain-containing protein [Bacteroidota bacterium]